MVNRGPLLAGNMPNHEKWIDDPTKMNLIIRILKRKLEQIRNLFYPFQPTEYSVLYCHERSLNQAGLSTPPDGPQCNNVTSEGTKGVQFTFLSFLQPFSEYNITIEGRVQPFQRSSRSLHFSARTCNQSYFDKTLCLTKS